MKRKILIITILVIFSGLYIKAQKILTLKECYEYAMATNALAGEKEAYANISKIRDENLSKGWLPSIDANASISYHSDVVDMSNIFSAFPLPGAAEIISPMPKDQYKITLDINQVIYDGGAIKSARALEKADLSITEKQTEADLYKIRGQLNAYYFRMMLLIRQRELLRNYHDLIKKRILSMQSAINNGVILKTDIDVLSSERIRLEQQLSENELLRNSVLKILSDLTGNVIDSSTLFVLPLMKTELTDTLLRPEIQIFDLRKEQLSAGLQMVQSKRMPKAFGFATLGYGNPPGSDFFNDSFDTYYIVGAGIKWNIFDWNKSKNEKNVISFQQGIVENRKKDMSDNLRRLLESKNAEILSLSKIIETDTELIILRKRITAAAESQYENGIITATEFLNELNSERQALVNFEIHKINLALARVEYLNISGSELE
jgi:outer membrane protein TolC